MQKKQTEDIPSWLDSCISRSSLGVPTNCVQRNTEIDNNDRGEPKITFSSTPCTITSANTVATSSILPTALGDDNALDGLAMNAESSQLKQTLSALSTFNFEGLVKSTLADSTGFGKLFFSYILFIKSHIVICTA